MLRKYPPEFATNGKLKKLYQAWADMRRRCSPTERDDSIHYYQKGIRVCDAWLHWPTFAAWSIANGWKIGLEIDRIDNSLGYSPDNCRFVTELEQNRNRDLPAVNEAIRRAHTKRWAKPFRCVDTGDVFLTQISAERKLGVSRKSIRYALNGYYKQAGGYRWEYLEASL